MKTYAYCDFGHLMTWNFAEALGVTFLEHVEEADAAACYGFESMGWPRVDGLSVEAVTK